MMGAIVGDIAGSIYERHNLKRKDFDLFGERNHFTDDSVLTVATAEALLTNHDFRGAYRRLAREYPQCGYGPWFRDWAFHDDSRPVWSLGSGAAMRVAPVAYAAKSLEDALMLAQKSAEVTHNHPEGVRGAEAVAFSVFKAKAGISPEDIRQEISAVFKYNMRRTVDEIRPGNRFDATAEGTVPVALTCAFEATSFEDAIRNAISVGGDSDTIAAIAGALAEALFGVPIEIEQRAMDYLDNRLKQAVVNFRSRFM